MNEEVVEELRKEPLLYQRNGDLVRVVTAGVDRRRAPDFDDAPDRGGARWCPAGRDLPLRGLLRSHREQGGVGGSAQAPAGVVRERGRRPRRLAGVRPLTGVVSFPVVRPDGTILTAPGYDPRDRAVPPLARPPAAGPGRPDAATTRGPPPRNCSTWWATSRSRPTCTGPRGWPRC